MSLYGFIRTYEELRRSQLRGQVLLGLEFRVWGRFGGEAWRTRNIHPRPPEGSKTEAPGQGLS